jgi:hypothetical protein
VTIPANSSAATAATQLALVKSIFVFVEKTSSKADGGMRNN